MMVLYVATETAFVFVFLIADIAREVVAVCVNFLNMLSQVFLFLEMFANVAFEKMVYHLLFDCFLLDILFSRDSFDTIIFSLRSVGYLPCSTLTEIYYWL